MTEAFDGEVTVSALSVGPFGGGWFASVPASVPDPESVPPSGCDEGGGVLEQPRGSEVPLEQPSAIEAMEANVTTKQVRDRAIRTSSRDKGPIRRDHTRK